MTDAKSALLEIALRAVQQHIERDEYAAAGDVVRQALARVEQLAAPEPRKADFYCFPAGTYPIDKPAQGERQPSDTARLDWLDTHPGAVVYSQGYVGSKSGWSYRDEYKAGQDATDLRAAIDASMK